MSQKIYIVSKDDERLMPEEIGYASSEEIAHLMVEKIAEVDNSPMICVRTYQATLDFLEINDELFSFEQEANNREDLILQFAILWGEKKGYILSPKDIQLSKEMSQYDSSEILTIFKEWADEYTDRESVDEFFERKITILLNN